MISFHQTHDAYEGRALVETKWGPLVVQSSVPKGLALEVYNLVVARNPELTASGDLFGDISKAFGGMAKSKVFADVTNVVSQVASNPLAQMAVSAVGSPAAGVALGMVGSAAGAAHKLAERARAGDPAAGRDVRDVAARAKAGDPKAKKAAGMLKLAFQAQQAKDAIQRDATPAPSGAPEFPYAQLVDFDRYRQQTAAPAPVAAEQQPDGAWSVWG